MEGPGEGFLTLKCHFHLPLEMKLPSQDLGAEAMCIVLPSNTELVLPLDSSASGNTLLSC